MTIDMRSCRDLERDREDFRELESERERERERERDRERKREKESERGTHAERERFLKGSGRDCSTGLGGRRSYALTMAYDHLRHDL